MLIVDAQVHIWAASTPERPWPARHAPHRPVPFSAEDLIKEMDGAGVDAAIIVPPGWEGDRNDLGLAAAAKYPERFAVMGRLDPEAPDARQQLATWLDQKGMLGIRVTFHTPQMAPLLTEGKVNWMWEAAEKAGIPMMVLVYAPMMSYVADVARKHPGLKITLDHSCIPKGSKGEASFAHFDDLGKLAALPNVSVKVTSLPSYATDAYPYPQLHAPVKKLYDTFGPKRMFWGTDLTRMPVPYRQAVTLFTEEMKFLSAEDRAWIMGRGLCEWIGWKHPRLPKS